MNALTQRTLAYRNRPTAQAITAAVGQWWRTRTQAAPRQLRLLETLPLGPKRSIAVLELDGQRFLAGMGADGVTTLLQVAPSVHAAPLSDHDGITGQ